MRLLAPTCLVALAAFEQHGVAAAAAAAAAAAEETVSLNLSSPSSPISQPHSPNFLSYSFEPAFWTEFFGEPSSPRNLTFTLLNHLHDRGVRSIIRAGGITMDSMIYNASQTASVVRTENGKGGIYRTTIGPNFYRQWSNFPAGTKFVSTLNFGNASVDIATELARASFSLQRDKILYYELGNEPTNYPSSRWRGSTEAYIAEWQRYTDSIGKSISRHSAGKWWASSATTDQTSLKVRPADLIPLGINKTGNVAQYSIHSYAFATCDPARERRATIENILNHTSLVHYADTEIYPSARAAMNANATWAIGEFNSIACSGKPNVSDTFAQALWTVDVELIYAVRNATSVHLHQGATLVFQSNQQLNTPGDDGTPGFSSYSLLYPVDSTKRGKARVLPVFVSQLLVAEALKDGGRIAALRTPSGVKDSEFSGYAIFDEEGRKVIRLVVLNMRPYYRGGNGAAARRSLSVNIGAHGGATVKRMTAPSVDEKFTGNVTWAGQSFMDGPAVGEVVVEDVPANGKVAVRDSEAVLVTFK